MNTKQIAAKIDATMIFACANDRSQAIASVELALNHGISFSGPVRALSDVTAQLAGCLHNVW